MSIGAAHSTEVRSRQIGFNLAMILLAAALAALGVAYCIDAVGQLRPDRPELSDSGPALPVHVGGKQLTVPRNWLRHQDGGEEGFASQLELSVLLPLGSGVVPVPVDVTLMPKSQVRTSAALLDRVYLHQFLDEELDAPVGLIGKPLVRKEGFQNESVWYDPLSPEPFVAKCMAPVDGSASGRCLRTVVLKDSLAAVYAFDQEVLGQWRNFDAAIRPWLERIGAF